MRKLFLFATITILLAACGSQSTDSPKGVVNAFIEEAKKGDLDGIKKYITSQDVKLLEIGENFMGMVDSSQKRKIKEKMANEFKENSKDVKIDIGNEKIDGDNATVDVAATKDGKTETHPFALKKENGQWKISLMSTGMKASGMTQEQMNEKMEKLNEGMKDMTGIKDSLAKAMEKIKGINTDSLKKIMNKSVEELEKLKEAAEKTNH